MGGSISGNFGNTKGSSLDALSNMLAAASLIPGLDTFTNFSIMINLIIRLNFSKIKKNVRNTDILGRFAGDKIGIIMPNTTENEAKYLCEYYEKLHFFCFLD